MTFHRDLGSWEKSFETGKAMVKQKTVSDVSDLVRRYGRALRTQLLQPKNAAKGHWSTVSLTYLSERLTEEIEEYYEVLNGYNVIWENPPEHKREEIKHELLDITAFCAFIWDQLEAMNED